jgi:hypothetical protein
VQNMEDRVEVQTVTRPSARAAASVYNQAQVVEALERKLWTWQIREKIKRDKRSLRPGEGGCIIGTAFVSKGILRL